MPATTTTIRDRTNLQAIGLEFRCTGAFDGETVVRVDLESVDPDPEDGIRRIEVEGNLGLIDLGLGAENPGKGTIGDRYVKGVVAGATGFLTVFVNGWLAVVDDVFDEYGGDPIRLETVRNLNALGGFEEPTCIFVPQGAYLGINGLAAPADPTKPNVIRFDLMTPLTVWDAALIEEGCCCDQGEDEVEVLCPVILDVSPSAFANTFDQTVTLFGNNFVEGQIVSVERIFPIPGPGIIDSVVVVDSETITFNFPSGQIPGQYEVTVSDPADPTCSDTANFTVVNPG